MLYNIFSVVWRFRLTLAFAMVVVMSGCEYNTLQEMQQKMAKHYLSGGDMDEADTSVPEILKPPVLGPEENPDAEVTN